MAIFKIINTKTTGHAALKSVLGYVLQESKTESHIVSGIGDFITDDEKLSAERVYLEFYRIKKLFGKDSGRQYMHAVQSYAKGESNPEQVHELGQKLASELWPDHQVLVVTHIDKEHLHNHFVVNTVSYMDSRKLHWKKQDLARAKTINDSLCMAEGLSLPEKGMHQDGTKIQRDEQSIYSKNLYHAVKSAKEGKTKSYVIECIKAVTKAIEQAISKTDFIERLLKDGFQTKWEDKRKYIAFSDAEGHKIRDTKIQKLTGIDCSKDALLKRFAQNEHNNDIHVLASKVAAIREQYIDVYSRRVRVERTLDEMRVKYTKQMVQKLKNLQDKLDIKDRQIEAHIQKQKELESEYKQITGYHLIQKERVMNRIRTEKLTIEQLKAESNKLISNGGYTSRTEIEDEVSQSKQEYEAILNQKRQLAELLAEQELLTIRYQELLVQVQDPKMIPKVKMMEANQAVVQAMSTLESIEKEFYRANDTETISYHM